MMFVCVCIMMFVCVCIMMFVCCWRSLHVCTCLHACKKFVCVCVHAWCFVCVCTLPYAHASTYHMLWTEDGLKTWCLSPVWTPKPLCWNKDPANRQWHPWHSKTNPSPSSLISVSLHSGKTRQILTLQTHKTAQANEQTHKLWVHTNTQTYSLTSFAVASWVPTGLTGLTGLTCFPPALFPEWWSPPCPHGRWWWWSPGTWSPCARHCSPAQRPDREGGRNEIQVYVLTWQALQEHGMESTTMVWNGECSGAYDSMETSMEWSPG